MYAAVVRRHRLRHLDQLRRARVRARRIDERGRDPERAVAHRVADDGAHRVELRWRSARPADWPMAYARTVVAPRYEPTFTEFGCRPIASSHAPNPCSPRNDRWSSARAGSIFAMLGERVDFVVRRRGRRRFAEDVAW